MTKGPMTPDRSNHHRFHLTRYFSLAALLTIVVAAMALGAMYRYFAEQHLIDGEEKHNAELTQYVSAMLWPKYGDFLTGLQGHDGDAIRANPTTAELHGEVLRQLRDTRIVKLKFFDPRGLTVYSSALKQIGADKSEYPGFTNAIQGRTTSHLSFRDSFYADANEAELKDRNLLSSYVPVVGPDGTIEGVAEVYNDVTPLLTKIETTNIKLVIATVLVMLVLYSVLYLIIKRADGIIREKSDEQQRNKKQIEHQANHDALTGLPNRRYFRELLGERMARAQYSEHLIAVMFIDLDRFKPINDTLGHQVGDELLQELAKRLSNILRDSDIVSRIGGDEFTVILDHLENVTNVERAAQRILNAIGEPIYLADKELNVGASIGISVYPFDDVDIDDLIKHADTAMYHAKESGRNCFHFFSEQMNAEAMKHMELERDLRLALRNGELRVHYQPRLDLEKNVVTGVEALVRWQHPERGMVSPAEFIPLAEESGQIDAIGHWVLKTACEDMVAMDAQGHQPVHLSVNVSAKQFEKPGFVDEVRKVMDMTGLPDARLELELTESVLMRNGEDVTNRLSAIRAAGIRLALDDFGTGYSSLSHLKELPLDVVKIDRSFIRDVTSDDRAAALTAAIAGLAGKLGMEVIAEGVETQEQLEFTRQCGCREAQGFLIARPMPLSDLQAYLSGPVQIASEA